MKARAFVFLLFLMGAFTVRGGIAHADHLPKGSFGARCLERNPTGEDTMGDLGCTRLSLAYQNPALDEQSAPLASVSAHCGFDGWNRRDNLRAFEESGRWGNRDFFFRVTLAPVNDSGTPAGQRTYRAEIPLTGREKALHCAVCVNGCGAQAEWDNNGGRDFAHAFRFPYAGPWLTLGRFGEKDLATSVQFEHHTETLGCIEYWPATAPSRLRRVCSAKATRVHRFRLTDLQPDTPYAYRVFANPGALEEPLTGSSQIWESQEFRFRSLPLSEPKEGWTILLMADTQDNGDDRSARYVMERIAATSDARNDEDPAAAGAGLAHFALIAGDLVFNDEPGLWWSFFDQISPLSSAVPLVPAVGNHDTPTFGSHPDVSSFRRYFDLDYTVDGSAHHALSVDRLLFLNLDSERPDEWQGNGTMQFDWLRAQLTARAKFLSDLSSSDRNAHWTFSQWHVPPFNAGARHAHRFPQFKKALGAVAGAVDWHFSGHEHLYQRSVPLLVDPLTGALSQADTYGPPDSTGKGAATGFVVLPPAGNMPAYELVPASGEGSELAFLRSFLAYPRQSGFSAQVNSEMGFGLMRIKGNSLNLRVFGLGRPGAETPIRLVDEVSQTKGERAP